MKKSQIFKLILSLLLPLGVGSTAGIFTAGAIPDWYSTLNRPVFTPPNWLFGPVWTALYLVMGVSLFLVWTAQKSSARNRAIFIFSVHLFLNFGWSFLFFYFNSIGLALIEIVLLLISIILMLIWFYKVKPIAAYINVPYLLWVTFATILNAAYFILNS